LIYHKNIQIAGSQITLHSGCVLFLVIEETVPIMVEFTNVPLLNSPCSCQDTLAAAETAGGTSGVKYYSLPSCV